MAMLTRSWMSSVSGSMMRTRLRCTSDLSPRITAAASGLTASPYSSSWLPMAHITSAYSFGRHAEALQDVLREERRRDAVVEPVDAVADVVQVAGDGGQLGLALGVAQAQQHVLGDLRDQPGVPVAVFRVAEHAEVVVGLADEDLHLVVAPHVLEGDRHYRTSKP